MRYELSDYDWTDQADAAQQATRRSACKWPSRPQWYLGSWGQQHLGATCQRTTDLLSLYLYRAEFDRTILQQDPAMSACRDPVR